jgi:hypothetical protein
MSVSQQHPDEPGPVPPGDDIALTVLPMRFIQRHKSGKARIATGQL